ncbi:MAG: SLBB domain-containing protein [bacterium]|nr:SLBB domain-containing protein [bacterium]
MRIKNRKLFLLELIILLLSIQGIAFSEKGDEPIKDGRRRIERLKEEIDSLGKRLTEEKKRREKMERIEEEIDRIIKGVADKKTSREVDEAKEKVIGVIERLLEEKGRWKKIEEVKREEIEELKKEVDELSKILKEKEREKIEDEERVKKEVIELRKRLEEEKRKRQKMDKEKEDIDKIKEKILELTRMLDEEKRKKEEIEKRLYEAKRNGEYIEIELAKKLDEERQKRIDLENEDIANKRKIKELKDVIAELNKRLAQRENERAEKKGKRERIVKEKEVETEKAKRTIPKSYVCVFGDVITQGLFTYRKGLTLGHTIIMAGGISDTATSRKVKVVRGKGKDQTIIWIDIGEIMKKGKNILLMPGDYIIVSE